MKRSRHLIIALPVVAGVMACCVSQSAAQLTVFDPATIADVSTYEAPHHFSVGIRDVLVNGAPVLRDGAMTTELPGKGTWYRVRCGNFASFQEATAAKTAFEQKNKVIALVAAR